MLLIETIETKIKYLGVKFKKGLKKSEIVKSGIIRDADNLCARILLFLLCFKAKDLEKIDVDLLRSNVSEYIDDDVLLDALDYFKENNILDYKYEKIDVAEHKGANMDKIVSLIGNISDTMNNMTVYKEPESTEQQEEFEKIYRLGKKKSALAIEPADDRIEMRELTEPIIEIKIEDEPKTEIESETETGTVIEIFDNDDDGIDFDAPVVKFEKEDYETLNMVCEQLEKDNGFRDLYNEVQHKLKAIINPSELEILYNLYTKTEPELLLMIAEYCGGTATNPKGVVGYFEKTALNLTDDGITTVEKYGKYLDDAQKVGAFEIKIRELFNLGDKKLMSKERQCIRTWVLEYALSDELLVEGYTKAFEREKATIPYVNTIYRNWHEKGFKSVDDVNNEFKSVKNGNGNNGKHSGDASNNSGSNNKKQAPAGFNSEHFFDKLARNSRKLLE